MKKNGYYLVFASTILAMLTVFALALASCKGAVFANNETMFIDAETREEPVLANDRAMDAGIKTPEERALANEATIFTETIDFNGKAVPLTETVETVADNARLKEEDWEITVWEDGSNDAQMVDRDAALKTALADVQAMAVRQADAGSVNIVLVEFSDLAMPMVPGTSIPLTRIPVWLITVDNIEIRKRGPGREDGSKNTALSTVHVVVDAYSGEILEAVYYSIGD